MSTAVMPPCRIWGWPFRAVPRAKRMEIALRDGLNDDEVVEEVEEEEVEAEEEGAG